MPFKSFVIPVRSGDLAERELNDFLRSHRVLAVDHRWVDRGENSFWAVLVDYLDSPVASSGQAPSGSKGKVDYKDVLSPEDFAVYSQLRAVRKELAEEHGVALYTVFNNEQLAQIVQGRARTQADLQRIAGVGNARAAKYGPRLLAVLNEVWKEADEANSGAAGTDS